MVTFKIVVSEPETRKSYQLEVDQSKVAGLIGKKIGEEFNGDLIGLPGYTLRITGGTDKDGFPMHPDVHGSVKKKALLAMPPGFHPKIKGQRKRKTVRGNTVSDQIVQINVKVTKKGEKPLEELVPTRPKEKKEEKPKEELKPKEVKEKPKEGEESKEGK
jgi:small subunit ribosomal protein S6e